jgi:hypothetical protein
MTPLDYLLLISIYLTLSFMVLFVRGPGLTERQVVAYLIFWPVVILKYLYIVIKYILLSFPTIFQD